LAPTDSSISDSALLLLVISGVITIWLLPYLPQIQSDISDFRASLEAWVDALNIAIQGFPGWAQMNIQSLTPKLIGWAILAFEIILSLGALYFILARVSDYCDKEYRKKLEREGKEHPQDRERRLAREDRDREYERRRKREEAERVEEQKKIERKEREERWHEDAIRAKQEEKERQEQARMEMEQVKREREEELKHEYHLDKDVLPQERKKMEEDGYERVKISPYGDTGASWYWVKKRDRESSIHSFFVYLIRDMVKKKLKDDIDLDRWHGADVVFDWNGMAYAFDVETGSIQERNPTYLAQRYVKYRKYYNKVFIFVTNKSLKKVYAQYGTVITRAMLKKAIERLFEE
jgi:hypothetical protein